MNKNQLRQRVNDVFSGVIGGLWDDNTQYTGAIELSKIIPALKAIFDPDEEHQYAFHIMNIDEFDTVESTTEWLWKVYFQKNEKS